jgi:hypothetical protein
MNDSKDKAKEFLYSYMDVEKDLSQPKILIHILQELINRYSSSLPPDPNMDEFYARIYGSESVIYVDDILTLMSELDHV